METISIESQAPGKLIPSETISAVIDAIAKRFTPCRIVLFGSYAIGAPTPDSDLDMLVVMETELPAYKRATPIRLIFDSSPCAMDLLVYTPKEVEYWNGTPNHIVTKILRRGKVVYEHRTE